MTNKSVKTLQYDQTHSYRSEYPSDDVKHGSSNLRRKDDQLPNSKNQNPNKSNPFQVKLNPRTIKSIQSCKDSPQNNDNRRKKSDDKLPPLEIQRIVILVTVYVPIQLPNILHPQLYYIKVVFLSQLKRTVIPHFQNTCWRSTCGLVELRCKTAVIS